MKPPELLAPAGDAACLTAALKAGADAVYFGAGTFNMRHKARNFSLAELPEVMQQCRNYGARGYLTLNTIIFENELTALETVVDTAQTAGVDAVIGWDPAVIQMVRKHGMDMHLSTQASVSNSAGIVEYYKTYGIRRFVMARECSLNDFSRIRQNLTARLGKDEADLVELEVFIHGAMCVSVSGRCFLSESVTGHSGNRGKCLQPCRREYRIIDTEGQYEFEIGRNYVMSPKDLCTMPFIDKILTSGAASLKIEGRMRNPEYVSTVTKTYRRAIDVWWKIAEEVRSPFVPCPGFDRLKKELTQELESVFNRGFHSGHYLGKPVGEWAEKPNSQADYKKETVGTVVNYFRKPGVAEIRIQSAKMAAGDVLLIQGSTTGTLQVEVNRILRDGISVDEAGKGSNVTVFVGERVRRGDAVFRRYRVNQPGIIDSWKTEVNAQ